MSLANLDSANLKGVADGGLINEDVMQQIWDISAIPLPFTDMMSSDSVKNSYTEWTQDVLQAVDVDNAAVDGADLTGNDTNTGLRVGNHCQISTKLVQVSTRARESDTIGRSDELSYQVMMRQRELRRDVEAISSGQQASVPDDGNATAGKAGAFAAWLTTNVKRGVGGLNGGYGATTPNLVDAPTLGTPEALTETGVRDIAQSVYMEGGNVTKLMMTPTMKRKFSEFMYTGQAKIAVLDSDVGQASDMATAKGAIDVFVSDFAILELIPNRLLQTTAANVSNALLIDPEYIRQGFLHGYRVEEQAKTGLSDKRQMIVDWTLKVLTEKAHGVIADIDETADVAA